MDPVEPPRPIRLAGVLPSDALSASDAAKLRKHLNAQTERRSRLPKTPVSAVSDVSTSEELERPTDPKPPRLDRAQIGELKRQLHEAWVNGVEAQRTRGRFSGLNYREIALADLTIDVCPEEKAARAKRAQRYRDRRAEAKTTDKSDNGLTDVTEARGVTSATPESTALVTPDTSPGLT